MVRNISISIYYEDYIIIQIQPYKMAVIIIIMNNITKNKKKAVSVASLSRTNGAATEAPVVEKWRDPRGGWVIGLRWRIHTGKTPWSLRTSLLVLKRRHLLFIARFDFLFVHVAWWLNLWNNENLTQMTT